MEIMGLSDDMADDIIDCVNKYGDDAVEVIKKGIEPSKIKIYSDVGILPSDYERLGIVGESKTKFNYPEDPIRDIIGTGINSNSEEWYSIIEDIENKGGSINYSSSDTLVYGPSTMSGKPGEITINTEASLSALKHEYQHFLDDYESGWQGMRIMWMEPEIRYQWEVNAYKIEVDIAKEKGLGNVIEQLVENLEIERKHIFGE